MQPSHATSSSSSDAGTPDEQMQPPTEQQAVPEPPPPPVGTTPPAMLVAQAAQGRRGAAWRLFHWISEDNREAIESVRRFPEGRLLERFLEWLALGTWAGKPLKLPAAMRRPHFRMQIRTLFLPGAGASSELVKQVLCNGLRDRQPAVREAAAHLLGVLGDPAVAPNLIAALRDEKSEVRVQAAKALGELGQAEAVPALVNTLSYHDEALAGQVRQTLLQFGPVAVPALVEAVRSSDAWVRWHALQTLGELHDRRCIPVLVEALADQDWAVAWMAARKLAPEGTLVIVPVLQLLLRVPATPWLMETAAYVLRQQRQPQLHAILAPVIHSMHSVDYRVTVPLAVEQALRQLAGLPQVGGP